jgi:hypothetical protein
VDAEFAINARAETVSADFRKTLKVWGYLVPPSGLTKSLQRSLGDLAAANTPLIVDNGLFDDISRISNSLASRIGKAKSALAGEEARLHRGLRWRDLKKSMAAERRELAQLLAAKAGSATGMTLTAQMPFATNAAIGEEDITAALWLRAGLDSPSMPGYREALRRRNRAVARSAAQIIASLTPEMRGRYLPVASAVDYDTAYDAGRAFGEAGLRAGAMGFGAFMADDAFADRFVIGRREHVLPRPLPMRYLRTALVARGLWDGWRAETGRAPRRFHFLGLGAPIMMPIAALAAWGTARITFDATSPIRDAVEGTVYSSLGAYLKIRTRRLAWRLATGQLRSWSCPCGFCRTFVRQHPFDYVRGRIWGRKNATGETVSSASLRPGGGLYRAYPLLAEPSGGARRRAVSYARAGHNHWVASEVMADLRAFGRTRRKLEGHVERIVRAYQQATSSAHFGEAVSLGFEIARGRFPK